MAQVVLLIGELEDADLHQLAEGRILEASVFHVVDEFRRDFEDANLDELIEGGLVAKSANFFDFLRIDALAGKPHQLIGVQALDSRAR